MKTDARVRYTQNIIRDTFLDLLKEKPIHKITIKEICEIAEINRGTFYKHYEDIYDLMQKLEDAALKQFDILLEASHQKGNLPVLVSLLSSLQRYQDLIEPLTANSLNSNFMKRMTDLCSRYALNYFSADNSNYDFPADKQYLYSYLAGGTTQLIEHWIKAGAHEAPAAIAEKIEHLNQLVLSSSL
ncbi:MAG: TetR/AcrR family transcriptional regulator [Lachnospiraceae bacterium]|nr:TetR/AcrR family transcriptional regulator [Lachnospiraceae bacterium]